MTVFLEVTSGGEVKLLTEVLRLEHASRLTPIVQPVTKALRVVIDCVLVAWVEWIPSLSQLGLS